MIPVALGLGSNKSFDGLSCLEILAGAVRSLQGLLRGLEISSVYKTRAMYYTAQDDFYNMAVLGLVSDETAAFGLLDKIQEIEADFGRDRSEEIRNGPRPLDIDIELFGSQKISAENLIVPHPRLKERAFVLVPLVEILAKDADNIKWKGFGPEIYSSLKRSRDALGGQGVALNIRAGDFLTFIKEESYGTRIGARKRSSR